MKLTVAQAPRGSARAHPGAQIAAPRDLRRDVDPGEVLDEPRHRLHDLQHLPSQLRRADLAGPVRHHRDLLRLRQRRRDLGRNLKRGTCFR